MTHALHQGPRICRRRVATSRTVGISDHAQSQLGDVVFVELPEVGAKFDKGAAAAVVESVKAASDVYRAGLRRSGRGQRRRRRSEPGLVNEDAQGRGWLFKTQARRTRASSTG